MSFQLPVEKERKAPDDLQAAYFFYQGDIQQSIIRDSAWRSNHSPSLILAYSNADGKEFSFPRGIVHRDFYFGRFIGNQGKQQIKKVQEMASLSFLLSNICATNYFGIKTNTGKIDEESHFGSVG